MSLKTDLSMLFNINEDDLNTVEEIQFTSVWDCGTEILSTAFLNTETGNIFDIEVIDDEDTLAELDSVDYEYISLRTGHDIEVTANEDNEYYISSSDLKETNEPTLEMSA